MDNKMPGLWQGLQGLGEPEKPRVGGEPRKSRKVRGRAGAQG